MSLITGVSAAAGLVGAYQGYQAQQRAQETREDQTAVLREHLEVAREKKQDYADALGAVERALEDLRDDGALDAKSIEKLERKGLHIDEHT